MAILGETGAGKTTLVQEWLARNNNTRSETPQGSIIPYLYVSVPAKASIKGTAAAFLSTLEIPTGTWHPMEYGHSPAHAAQKLPGTHDLRR
ncbi:TniB family NTP-binding protein [Ktedonobacter robiniae]|uniref:AAA+ ATPase domain-containing protein n=1 Tax=Ktedonobacter robiniae TaxID=2778365 RepID=A0ABQ3V791_9CHLR|nr:TniB family NTP-binding protein [Ktedonobacter robiniae]GHO60841.1 hypothetical protein KSB_93160 [Ktedonobacter robiniae]